MVKVSIIIPHFNCLNRLLRLLDSIPRLAAIEIIIVDDNSTSDSRDEISSAMRHRKVKLFTNQTGNKGAGACRNIGIKNATGRWLLFADSDDYFIDGFYNLINKYYDSDAEIVFFPPTSIIEDSKEKGTRHLIYEKLALNYYENPHHIKSFKDLKFKFISPCSKLIKREYIANNKIFFDEILASNDAFFSIISAHYAKKIAVSKEYIYVITTSKGSLTRTLSFNILSARIFSLTKVNAFFKSVNEEKYVLSYAYLLYLSKGLGLRVTIRLFFQIIKDGGNPFVGCLNKLRNFVKKYKNNQLENNDFLIKL